MPMSKLSWFMFWMLIISSNCRIYNSVSWIQNNDWEKNYSIINNSVEISKNWQPNDLYVISQPANVTISTSIHNICIESVLFHDQNISFEFLESLFATMPSYKCQMITRVNTHISVAYRVTGSTDVCEWSDHSINIIQSYDNIHSHLYGDWCPNYFLYCSVHIQASISVNMFMWFLNDIQIHCYISVG